MAGLTIEEARARARERLAAQQPEADEPAAVGVGEDVGRGAAAGLFQGGLDLLSTIVNPGGAVALDTSTGVQNTIEDMTGRDFYKAETGPGKIAQAGLRGAAAGAAGGPAAGAAKVGLNALRYGVAPMVASEVAGQATEGTIWENPARIAAGVATGAAVPAVKRVITPRNIPEINAQHARTLQGEGITNLTEGQVSGRKGVQAAERQRLAASGSGDARRVEQWEQLTQAVLKRIGVLNERRATRPVVAKAFKDVGQTFNDLASRNIMRVDDAFHQRFAGAVDEYNDLVPESARAPFVSRFRNEIEDLYTTPGPGAVMSGKKYQKYRSRLERYARNTKDPELRTVFREMRESLDEAMDRSVQSSDAGAWKKVRQQYRDLLVVEDATTMKTPEANVGLITPPALQTGVTNVYGQRNLATGQGPLTELSTAASGIMTELPLTGAAPLRAPRGLWDAQFLSPLDWAGRGVNAARMTGPVQNWLTNRKIARPPQSTLPAEFLPGLFPQASQPYSPIVEALSGDQPQASPIDPRTQSVIDALQ